MKPTATIRGCLGRPCRGRLTQRLARPLAALGLLLATAGAAQAQTTTFTYTAPGSAQTYTVPAGVTRLQLVATGAAGGSRLGSTPGNGAQVQATVTVTPGEVLTVVVGSVGANDVNNSQTAGGYNAGAQALQAAAAAPPTCDAPLLPVPMTT